MSNNQRVKKRSVAMVDMAGDVIGPNGESLTSPVAAFSSSSTTSVSSLLSLANTSTTSTNTATTTNTTKNNNENETTTTSSATSSRMTRRAREEKEAKKLATAAVSAKNSSSSTTSARPRYLPNGTEKRKAPPTGPQQSNNTRRNAKLEEVGLGLSSSNNNNNISTIKEESNSSTGNSNNNNKSNDDNNNDDNNNIYNTKTTSIITTSRRLSVSSRVSDMVVQANMVSDTETIFVATDVREEDMYRRRVIVLCMCGMIAFILLLGLIFGLQSDDDDDYYCSLEKKCCALPIDDDDDDTTITPSSMAPLRCYCFNDTDGIYENFSDEMKIRYDTGQTRIGSLLGISDETEILNLDVDGCDPINQILLNLANTTTSFTSDDDNDEIDIFDEPKYVQTFLFALDYLFVTLNGVNWFQGDNWFQSRKYCNYYGADCWYGSTIHGLNLANNNLMGEFPTVLGKVKSLHSIDLSGNEGIFGQIPSELSQITYLVELRLNELSLTGTIPTELGTLEELEIFILKGSNGLVGGIPSEIFLPNLKALDLSQNPTLQARIPPEIENAKRLNLLNLGNTGLTSPLPTEIGQMFGLVYLDVSENLLSESVPESWGNLPKLEFLNLANSGLTGRFPETFCDSTSSSGGGATLIRRPLRRHVVVECSDDDANNAAAITECSCCSRTNRSASVFFECL